MRMRFGKYGPSNTHPKGVDIVLIPTGYLKWLLNQKSFVMRKSNEKQVVAIEEELRQRDWNKSHFYEDKVEV